MKTSVVTCPLDGSWHTVARVVSQFYLSRIAGVFLAPNWNSAGLADIHIHARVTYKDGTVREFLVNGGALTHCFKDPVDVEVSVPVTDPVSGLDMSTAMGGVGITDVRLAFTYIDDERSSMLI